MGIFRSLAQTAGEHIFKSKDEREAEKNFVRENKGTEAICAFIAQQFEKGNPGYNWVKKNKVGLYPIVHDSSVSLCYMQPGDGESFSGMRPKDIEVASYSFLEIYEWFGLEEDEGYRVLKSRTQKNELENMISSEVQKLAHIKYNNGFMVKLFQ